MPQTRSPISPDELEDFRKICAVEGVNPDRFTLEAVTDYPEVGVAPLRILIWVSWTRADGTQDQEPFEGGAGSTWVATFGHQLRSGQIRL